MSKWAIGRLRTGFEAALSDICDQIGVESYYPTVRRKGARRRGEPGREAIEAPALPGYLPMRAATVEAPEARERLYQEPAFYDFLRDPWQVVALMDDEDLNPLRAMEKVGEPVKFHAGPIFHIGETVKVPFNNPHVNKSWWGMSGQVVGKRNGRYCLSGIDFSIEAWFSGMQLCSRSQS